MYRKKGGKTPITLEKLVQKGRGANGWSVWVDGPDGPGTEERKFDRPTSSIMTLQQYAEVQKLRHAAKPHRRHRDSALGGLPEDLGPVPVPYAESDPSVVPGPIDFRKFDPSVARNGHSLR